MIYTVEQIRHIATPIARSYGVKSLSLFGSYARGEATENSDIDLLVKYTDSDSISLFTISRIVTTLRKMTGKSIDLIERSQLLPFASPSAEQDKILIYERKN